MSFDSISKLLDKPNPFGKGPEHQLWRQHYTWFREQGYLLRDFYRPDWIPSWELDKSKRFYLSEDSYVPPGNLIDAVRCSDGLPVMMKRVPIPRKASELEIAQFFNSASLCTKDDNFSVPIYETLHLPGHPEFVLIVMPLLREWDMIPFETLGEIINFCLQAFKGLRFMHRNNIAHCDCKTNNILIDATPLFDEDPQPISIEHSKDFSRFIRPYSRTQRPVRYYWIDFGLSVRHDPAHRHASLSSLSCGDKSIPERFLNPPYDPFALDVYCAGNILNTLQKNLFIGPIRGLDCLLPLLADMTGQDPKERPNMEEVVERLEGIVAGLSIWKLRSRIWRADEHFILMLVFGIWHWIRQFVFHLQGLPALPRIPPRVQHITELQ